MPGAFLPLGAPLVGSPEPRMTRATCWSWTAGNSRCSARPKTGPGRIARRRVAVRPGPVPPASGPSDRCCEHFLFVPLASRGHERQPRDRQGRPVRVHMIAAARLPDETGWSCRSGAFVERQPGLDAALCAVDDLHAEELVGGDTSGLGRLRDGQPAGRGRSDPGGRVTARRSRRSSPPTYRPARPYRRPGSGPVRRRRRRSTGRSAACSGRRSGRPR
jgi:hypothetical protein